MATGRPLKWDDPEHMGEAIEAYFAKCDEEGRPYTIAGMAYELGFEDRHSIAVYEQRDRFSATIKRARTRIEMQRSEKLVTAQGNVTGMIFDLKNNFGWKDKTEQDINANMTGELRWMPLGRKPDDPSGV